MVSTLKINFESLSFAFMVLITWFLIYTKNKFYTWSQVVSKSIETYNLIGTQVLVEFLISQNQGKNIHKSFKMTHPSKEEKSDIITQVSSLQLFRFLYEILSKKVVKRKFKRKTFLMLWKTNFSTQNEYFWNTGAISTRAHDSYFPHQYHQKNRHIENK